MLLALVVTGTTAGVLGALLGLAGGIFLVPCRRWSSSCRCAWRSAPAWCRRSPPRPGWRRWSLSPRSCTA